MRIPIGSSFVMLAMVACSSQSPQPQNENVVNAVQVDVAVPTPTNAAAPAVSGAQGNSDQSETRTPEQVVRQYAALLHQRRFAEAYALWGPKPPGMTEKQFEARFDEYRTIDAAVGKIGPTEGAAGSIYGTVQLTLSGEGRGGKPYTVTGPVTLRRVNDVPGSTAEQRRWHIVKVELTADPKAAQASING